MAATASEAAGERTVVGSPDSGGRRVRRLLSSGANAGCDALQFPPATPSRPRPDTDGGMVTGVAAFADYIDDGLGVLDRHAWLVAVPVVSGVLGVGNIARVLAHRGFYVGVSFPLPAPIVDVWTFVNPPQDGVTTSATVLIALALAVVHAALSAGYLSCLRDALAGERPDFRRGVGRYLLPLLGFQLLASVTVLAGALLAVPFPPLFVLVLPLFLLVGYLFFGAPYLVVAEERRLVDALARSYRFALAGGPYFAFAAGYLLIGTAVSVVATLAVVNLGVVGVLLGAVVAGPVGVVLGAATMAMIRDMPARVDGL